jgi:hypothetical protein
VAPTEPPPEATVEILPTEIRRTVIPPTAALGEEIHLVIEEEITSPGQEVTSTFNALPGQEFFFGVVTVAPELNLVDWRVVDGDGVEIFRTCLGCGQPGVFALQRGGEYRVVVGEPEESGVGRYQVVVASVRVHYFPFTLGQPIAIGQPGPGAGSIETPGARDMYSFQAEAGQEVFFGVVVQNNVPLVDTVLLDQEAVEVFRLCLGCGNAGVYTLERGGPYMLVVGGTADLYTGTYELAVVEVRTDTFAINPGATISDGFPGPGAGNIETPGARDVYTFNASPGQQVTIEVIDALGLELIDWILTDEDGAEVFNTCLGCGSPGTVILERGGAYTLTVGGTTDIETGTYHVTIQ